MTFFKQNPNVRSFATNSAFLTANLDLFRTTDIRLDKLAIRFDGNHFLEICETLKSLHERGAFQRLHWYTKSLPSQVAQVIPLNALKKLMVNFWSARECTNLSPLLINITELSIRYNGSNMETAARNLVGHGFQIWNWTKGALDLAAWNKEREKLAGARKVTIYVDEDIYLATKWATNETDYDLIELKRGNSYDWDDDFIY
ncbi:uncharacterized protein LOC129569870 [Sitodiplosis mosellana]|uniref:uncharacterized protein LOC129569870 n=1 Tax=Sitodiplosis mosellana TaxID=263140 RepID=UPI00244376A7|nr:uncharacterized protein LOC129569870 [Sitodiplosis mosellana]